MTTDLSRGGGQRGTPTNIELTRRRSAELFVVLRDEHSSQAERDVARDSLVHLHLPLVEHCARSRGHSVRRLASGAGHDAQMLARVCPSAMIFVPSRDGLSHNVAEFTEPADLAAGVEVLFDVNGGLDEEGVEFTLNFFTEAGVVEPGLTVDQIADLSHLEGVLEEIGRQ